MLVLPLYDVGFSDFIFFFKPLCNVCMNANNGHEILSLFVN